MDSPHSCNEEIQCTRKRLLFIPIINAHLVSTSLNQIYFRNMNPPYWMSHSYCGYVTVSVTTAQCNILERKNIKQLHWWLYVACFKLFYKRYYIILIEVFATPNNFLFFISPSLIYPKPASFFLSFGIFLRERGSSVA
jgi:hypothetical protein